MNKSQALGLMLIAAAAATTLLLPGVGLADEFLIPLGAYLVYQGGKSGKRRKGKSKGK